MCRHIVSVKGWGPAYSLEGFIKECEKHKVIDADLADKLTRSMGLRNIIVHRYLDVDYDQLYEEAKLLLQIAKGFIKQVTSYIAKNNPIG